MENRDVSDWFDEYLEAFAGACRGESDTAALLAYYAVPLLLTTDGGFYALNTGEQVVGGVGKQVDDLHAAVYGRTEIIGSGVTVLNATSALYRGTLSRQRDDGSEISRITATYLITDGAAGRRISVLAVHGT